MALYSGFVGSQKPEQWFCLAGLGGSKLPAFAFDKPCVYLICTVFIIGLVAHGFMIFNKLSFDDDVLAMFDFGQTYSMGRWFLGMLLSLCRNIFGVFSMPLFNVFWAFVFIALSGCLIIKLFHIQKPLTAILIGGLMVTIPVVATTFMYMFTGTVYFIALFMNVLAIYCTEKFRNGWLAGILLICFALGIYQAYIAVSATLFIMLLILQCKNDGKYTIESLFAKALKDLLVLLCAVGLYIVINKLCIQVMNIEMTSYQGLDNMGNMTLPQFIENIKNAYLNFMYLATRDVAGLTNNKWIRWIIRIEYLLYAFFFIHGLMERKGVWRWLFLLFCLLFPLAVSIMCVMTAGSSTALHTVTRYSAVMVMIFPIILIEKVKLNIHIDLTCNWTAVICSSILIFYYCFLSNEAYLNLFLLQEQGTSYFTTLVTRIQSTEGYDASYPVAFIGTKDTDGLMDMSRFNNLSMNVASMNLDDLINGYAWKGFMEMHTGYQPTYVEDVEFLSELQIVKDMPCYPSDDSIQVINDIVVVKFSD